MSSITHANWQWFDESQLPQAYATQIEPFWQQQAQALRWVSPKDGVTLSYYRLDNPNSQRVIIVHPGRAEAALKYQELAYELFHNGFAVLILDPRGQGESQRLATSQAGHVDDFNDYIDDLDTWYKGLDLSAYNKRYLLAHSMGGAIGAGWLARNPKLDAAVLGSPMMRIAMGIPGWLRGAVAATVDSYCSWFADGSQCYAPGQGDWQARSFAENDLSNSEVRFARFASQLQQQPQLRLGGPSIGWIRQAVAIEESYPQWAANTQIPVLVLQAQLDTVVDNSAQFEYCQHLPTHGACPVVITGAKHELYFEQDPQRQAALNQALDFFLRN